MFNFYKWLRIAVSLFVVIAFAFVNISPLFSQPIEDPVRGALRSSLLYFIQIINSYQRDIKFSLPEIMLSAAEQARKAKDFKLGELFESLRKDFMRSQKLNPKIISAIAKIFNGYIEKYSWAYPFFDPDNLLNASEPY